MVESAREERMEEGEEREERVSSRALASETVKPCDRIERKVSEKRRGLCEVKWMRIELDFFF